MYSFFKFRWLLATLYLAKNAELTHFSRCSLSVPSENIRKPGLCFQGRIER